MIPEIDFDPETDIHKHLEVKGSGQGGYQKIEGGIQGARDVGAVFLNFKKPVFIIYSVI